jgi:hypothetical protein
MMVSKGLRFLFPAALALLVASQWQDVVRYLRLKQLRGTGSSRKCAGPRPGVLSAAPG